MKNTAEIGVTRRIHVARLIMGNLARHAGVSCKQTHDQRSERDDLQVI